jgi:hypothetical protein
LASVYRLQVIEHRTSDQPRAIVHRWVLFLGTSCSDSQA